MTEDGKFVGARVSRSWHSDGQYLAAPTKASILHAREVPPDGGDTLFVDMAAVLDALPAATRRRIAGLKVVHSRVKTHAILFPSWAPLTEEEKARMPDAVHPLVRTHPETGRQALYVGGNSAWEIEGMAHDEGRALIGELRDFATGPALRPRLPVARGRRRNLGQPLGHALSHRLRRDGAPARHVPHHRQGRRARLTLARRRASTGSRP